MRGVCRTMCTECVCMHVLVYKSREYDGSKSVPTAHSTVTGARCTATYIISQASTFFMFALFSLDRLNRSYRSFW